MAKNLSYLLIVLVIVLIYLMDFTVIETMQSKAKKVLVLRSLKCDGEKKSWLAQVASYSIKDLDYANVQLSYIDNEGKRSVCTAGWEGLPYFTRSVTQNTTLNYASVTKIFTSELILNLVRTQQINLDDKLVTFLPEIRNTVLKDIRINDITISDLLSHRAGFDRNITNDTMLSVSPWCPYRIEALKHIVLDFDPNSKMVYSNVGYCLLSQVIESVYSKSYIDVSQEYFKFNDSHIYFIQENSNDIANVPDVNKNGEMNQFDFFALSSVGGLAGTSNDLSRYLHAMDRQTYPNITSRLNVMNCDIQQVRGCHGFSGYEYAPHEGLTVYWRDGRLPKSSALVTMDSDGGVMAFLSNSENEATWLDNHNKLVENIYDSYLYQEK